MTKRLLVVGGVLAALAVPAGVAVAATTSPSPGPKAPATTQPYGPGSGRMMGGTGDPQDCPYYNSPEMQKWREQRAERQQLAPADRQKLMEQMRDRMWSQRTGTTASS